MARRGAMTKRGLVALAALSLSAGRALAQAPETGVAAPAVHVGPCDRQCLAGTLDAYLAALVAHDPQRLAWSAGARLTENGMPLRIGDGLWSTASALGRFRLTFLDPAWGAAVFYGALIENGNPIILALRLKIAGRRIAEAEHIVTRSAAAAQAFDARTPDPLMATPGTASRDALAAAPSAYFDGIEQVSARGIRFAAECRRVENGTRTTGVQDLAHGPFLELDSPSWRAVLTRSCAESIDSGANAHISQIADRRIVVLDEAQGVAVAIGMFTHPGTLADVHVPGHDPIVFPAPLRQPFDALIMEAFKLDRSGAIVRVEATGALLPYGSRTGWPD